MLIALLAAALVAIVNAPAIVQEGYSITLQVRVEPHADNRLLIVSAWDGDVAVRTSLEQLDGESSPRTRWIKWGSLSACECELRAYLYVRDRTDPKAIDRRPLVILSRY